MNIKIRYVILFLKLIQTVEDQGALVFQNTPYTGRKIWTERLFLICMNKM